jgi:hypothetical protein
MSKVRVIVVTAVLAASAGYVAAQPLRGHPNLQKARVALNNAERWISASQEANEAVWKDEGGHGQKAKALIEQAKVQLDAAAEWVNHHERGDRRR